MCIGFICDANKRRPLRGTPRAEGAFAKVGFPNYLLIQITIKYNILKDK